MLIIMVRRKSVWRQKRVLGGGLERIRVEGLFSVWLRPDGRRKASVAPGLCAVW